MYRQIRQQKPQHRSIQDMWGNWPKPSIAFLEEAPEKFKSLSRKAQIHPEQIISADNMHIN